jgi:hypothetical protein
LRKEAAQGGIGGSRREGEPSRTNQERQEELAHLSGGVGLWKEQLEREVQIDGKVQSRQSTINTDEARKPVAANLLLSLVSAHVLPFCEP